MYGKGSSASTIVLPVQCPAWAGRSAALCHSLQIGIRGAPDAARTAKAPASLDLASLPAERIDPVGAGGVGADRRLPLYQRVHSRVPGRLPAEQCAAGPGQRRAPRGQGDRQPPARYRGTGRRLSRCSGRGPGRPPFRARRAGASAPCQHPRRGVPQPQRRRPCRLLLCRQHAGRAPGPRQGAAPVAGGPADALDQAGRSAGGGGLLQQLGQLQPHLPLFRCAAAVPARHGYPAVQLLLPGRCHAQPQARDGVDRGLSGPGRPGLDDVGHCAGVPRRFPRGCGRPGRDGRPDAGRDRQPAGALAGLCAAGGAG